MPQGIGQERTCRGLVLGRGEGGRERNSKTHRIGCRYQRRRYDGRTTLHAAASEGQAVSVQYILQNGGKRDAKDRWGNTPMDDARRSGHLSTAEIFEHIQG